MVLIVMIIEGKLLLAIGGIIGMIQIEHDSRRRLGVSTWTEILAYFKLPER
jgi:hypothetical protein